MEVLVGLIASLGIAITCIIVGHLSLIVHNKCVKRSEEIAPLAHPEALIAGIAVITILLTLLLLFHGIGQFVVGLF